MKWSGGDAAVAGWSDGGGAGHRTIDSDSTPAQGVNDGLPPEMMQKAVQAGAGVAFGTGAAVYPHGGNAMQSAVAVVNGMTPMDAILPATLHTAELSGVAGRT